MGKLAVTRELSSDIETWGVGKSGETGMAAGFLERSIFGRKEVRSFERFHHEKRYCLDFGQSKRKKLWTDEEGRKCGKVR